MPHAACLCKLRSEWGAAEEAWQGRAKGTCESRTKCERDSLIYGQQRIKTRHRHRYQLYTHAHTHTHRDTTCVYVCACGCVWHADDDPKNLHENFNCQRIHFHLKFMTCARWGRGEKGQGDECVWSGGGRGKMRRSVSHLC